MKQSDVFLDSEGDAYYRRNGSGRDPQTLPASDPLLLATLGLPATDLRPGARLLEIGCSDGLRLQWLREHHQINCTGIEPSAAAVATARERGIDARQGTADTLPFADGSFDIVLFGFCLYLCDPQDLFRIASEADRVLANPGWLLILDFYSETPTRRAYHHRSGLFSRKMDYRTLFTWHPAYTCMSQNVVHHSTFEHTDDPTEWIATSVLRKHLRAEE